MTDFKNVHEYPLKAALMAAEAIMRIYKQDFEKYAKADGSPVTKADLTSSAIISEELKKTGLPITGEETAKAPFSERKKWRKSWCVDPLDGTKEFIKKNDEFVINIALIEDQKPTFGLIASPVLEKIILGGPEFGAYSFPFEASDSFDSWEKLPAIEDLNSPLQVISSRSHYSGDLLTLIKLIENDYGRVNSKKMGSALKFFDLVTGKADVYPRFAPTMEWDIAAGQAIYESVGGRVWQRGKGQPLIYNKENLLNPFFVANKKIMSVDLT
ncbi:MAG: 3'(2'),5'-bisphosphate nucleotidase CysQ [Brumimicrobium sp.]|nr:3'(2'),5'-bisphosphate nucleotidase CysQ [Brumimicrobium sp.]